MTTSPVSIKDGQADGPCGTVLMLRALALGDFLAAVPAYRALRRAYPQRRLLLAAPAGLAPLLPLTQAVDGIVPVRRLGEPIPWPGRPPDLAVNLHGRGPDSHRMLEALHPRAMLAFAHAACPHRRGPRWRPGEHEHRRWCRLLTHYSIPADPADLGLAVPEVPAPAAGVVVVHPGAGQPSRRWPADRFAAVTAALRSAGHDVVLTGTVAERPLCEHIAGCAGLPAEAVLAGRTGLLELAAVVAAARLVVSNDTGVAHLATAYRVPSIVLFGPTGPHEWGPPPDRPRHRALWGGRGRGDRLAVKPDPSLLDVTVEQVLDAAACLLDRFASAAATAPGHAEGRGHQSRPVSR